MDGNICRFVQRGRDAYRMDILYYVLETKPQHYEGLKVSAFYTMYLAVAGDAVLHTSSGSSIIRTGDIFFSLPAVPFAIEGGEGFRYIYISYMGPRANALMDYAGINANRCVFRDHGELIPMWSSGLGVADEAVALRSEGIILYTLSELGMQRMSNDGRNDRAGDAANAIKKYIDENFSSQDMTLETVSRRFSYNPKYVSSMFKEHFGVNFSEYLNSVRIQHACALMDKGFTSVKDIAQLCGFRDPMYFSRVFKMRTGSSPRSYCDAIK